MEPYIRKRATFIIDPIVKILVAFKFTPDSLTIAGFLLNVVAGVLIALGQVFWGGFVMTFIAMPLDGLDGPLARATGKQGKWGAFLDSTLDRYAESAILIGLCWHYQNQRAEWMVLASTLAIVGSLMVSYSRAKAESLGLHGEVGLFSRFGRFVLLVFGTLIGAFFPLVLDAALVALAVLANVTAIQRMRYVAKNT